MRILNYNDYFRHYIYVKSKDKSSQECLNLFNRIKENDDYSKFLSGLLYESSYLSCIGQLKFHPRDKKLKENLEFLQEMNDIEEFILSLDKEIFDELCEDVGYFYILDYYSKRNFVSYLLEHGKFLNKVYPYYIIDVLFYLNKYDASIIIDTYYERLHNNDKNPFLNTIKSGVEELLALKEQDFFSYKYIVLDMIEGFYKYNKYLEALGIADGDVEDLISKLSKDLNSFIYVQSKEQSVLSSIIEGYLKYNIASSEDLEIINDYFEEEENNKEITKILQKRDQLKNEK